MKYEIGILSIGRKEFLKKCSAPQIAGNLTLLK